jgi:hypothetical protein
MFTCETQMRWEPGLQTTNKSPFLSHLLALVRDWSQSLKAEMILSPHSWQPFPLLAIWFHHHFSPKIKLLKRIDWPGNIYMKGTIPNHNISDNLYEWDFSHRLAKSILPAVEWQSPSEFSISRFSSTVSGRTCKPSASSSNTFWFTENFHHSNRGSFVTHLTTTPFVCVGNLQIPVRKENKVKGTNGEAMKIYRVIAAFYKTTMISRVWWNFIRAGFHLNPNNLLAPLTVNPEIVLEWIAIPEIPTEELVTSETTRLQIGTDGDLRRRHRTPGPHEFAVSLQAYVNKTAVTCRLCC